MFSRFLKRRAPVKAPLVPTLPDGVVVWAIGDIHGRLDLLQPLAEVILADLASSNAQRKVVVFLGDYIDRGPDSRGVLAHLEALSRDGDVEWHFLKGNHEEAMLAFLADPAEGEKWCEYGGGETLASYGLKVPQLKHRVEAWEHLSADLDHRMSDSERTFLETLTLSVSIGDYFFAHAGARPGKPLDQQTPRDLMWIRGSFLNSEESFDRVVVHGHTPASEVHIDHRRIGLDTRAYASGVLSAVRLSGVDQRVYQTGDGIVRVAATLSMEPVAGSPVTA